MRSKSIFHQFSCVLFSFTNTAIKKIYRVTPETNKFLRRLNKLACMKNLLTNAVDFFFTQRFGSNFLDQINQPVLPELCTECEN